MDQEQALLDREWFYPFELPSGAVTPTYAGGKLNAVHATRLAMMDKVLDQEFGPSLAGRRAVDLACHQGYFASKLAARGADEVIGVDARSTHVEDTNLIADVLGYQQLRAMQSDVHAVDTETLGEFDVVLMLGLIYHLENPIGAMRVAHALTRRVCLLETQVVPHLSGPVDWGNYTFVKDMKGCFGIIDEVDETHGPEASTLGICLAPSTPGLLWVMKAIGFDRVELLEPPEGAYEQHRFGKRVMVAAWKD